LQAASDLVSIGVWHADVEQRQVGTKRLRYCDRARSIRDRSYVITAHLEEQRGAIDGIGVVVNHQHAKARAFFNHRHVAS